MEETTQIEEKSNNKLPAGETDDVNSEVVPSVDSDKNSSDWNLSAKTAKLREDVQKRKRPRRKSKKRKNPYAKASWQQRREMRGSERAQSVRQQMFLSGQPVAPYNTTQFLIEDHGDLQNIDAQLQVARDQNVLFNNKPSRARDSSFSVDSDEDYFYSSPEDEEEFLTREFSNAYEDLHMERLSSMAKAEIIHDYLQLEARYEKAIIELKRLKKTYRDEAEGSVPENGGDSKKEHDRDTNTSSKYESELAEQLRISELENKSLRVELEEMKREIKKLQNVIEDNRSTTSVDSESDSTSTSSMSSAGSSCDSDSDDEMNSTQSTARTQVVNNSDSVLENNIENESNVNGMNGSLPLSDYECSGDDEQES